MSDEKEILDRAYRMLQRPDTYRAPAWQKLTRDILELRLDAAEDRDRLRARVEVLEAALRPLAREWRLIGAFAAALDNAAPYFTRTTGIKVGDLRRAAEALAAVDALAAGEKP
jgi:hypothetical protein